MSGITYTKDANDIVTLTIGLHGKVNKIDAEFIKEMSKAITKLEQESTIVKGVIVTSAKSTFIAGADLAALLKAEPKDASDLLDFVTTFKALLRRLEKRPYPVVAAINGTALGGGIEFSLACDHRIALDAPHTQLGLPEVNLGLLPGGGGLVRFIHTVGVEAALTYILSGKIMTPKEAKKIGLIDDMADDADHLMKKSVKWIQENPQAHQPWDAIDHKIPGGDLRNAKIARWMVGTTAMMVKKSGGCCSPAIQEILNVSTQTLLLHFDAAQKVESRGLVKLLLTQEAKNRIGTFFFGLNAINNGSSRPQNIAQHVIKKIGILGAGMMGRGIAVVSAKCGIEVILKDINLSTAHTGKVHCEELLAKSHNKKAILDRIHPTADANDLQDCDLIIEAVYENTDTKASVTREAEPFLKKGGIFASNTSTLPITLLANATQNPEHFIGIHFFSPVDKMRLVEIIVGKKTSPETLAKAFDFAQQIHKVPIVVNDSRGFFTSRVFGTYIDEGARLLEEGVKAAKIENSAKLAGMPTGPLAITDEVSQHLLITAAETNAQLDTVYGKSSTMTGEASLRVAKKLVDEFHRGGRAYNGGFYEYPQKGKKYLWPELKKLYHNPSISLSKHNIQDRLLFRQAIEAVRCYEEGVFSSVAEANIGSIFGIGFPAHTGGILQFINAYGLPEFVARAQTLAAHYGERFTPPHSLITMASEGRLFE